MAAIRDSRSRGGSDTRRVADLSGARITALVMLGVPATLPLVFIAPAAAHESATAHAAGNDVLGTGGALLLFAMLAITPLITATGFRWFVGLRQWYGIMFAVTVIADAAIASNDPAFGTNPVADLTGHTFLLVGLTMVVISIPLLVTASKRAMVYFGRYWKMIQAIGTYAIWALLGVHLMLLEGFGHSATDRFGVPHQRLYEYVLCSIPLALLRLPVVRRFYRHRERSASRRIVTAVLVTMFAAGYIFFINELLYKGIAAWHLTPIND